MNSDTLRLDLARWRNFEFKSDGRTNALYFTENGQRYVSRGRDFRDCIDNASCGRRERLD